MKCFVEPSDEVIMPTCSFVGAANAVVDRGARVVFCDVDKLTLNATAKAIEEKFRPQRKPFVFCISAASPANLTRL